MAYNSLVIGSKFKPFSYAEMLHPVAESTTAHRELENAYGELDTKSSVWEGMTDKIKDVQTHERYQNYANKLKEQADILATQGINPNSRKALLKLQAQYASDIIPIEQKYKKREELVAEQRKLKASDPTLHFNVDYGAMSLDDMMDKSEHTYDSYSGQKVTMEVAQQASNLANELRSYSLRDLTKYRDIFEQKYGLTSSDIAEFIKNPNSNTALNKIKESVVNTYINKGFDANTINDYADRGLWSAIGKSNVNPMENKEALMQLQENMIRTRPSKEDKPQSKSILPLNSIPIGFQNKQGIEKSEKLKKSLLDGVITDNFTTKKYKEAINVASTVGPVVPKKILEEARQAKEALKEQSVYDNKGFLKTRHAFIQSLPAQERINGASAYDKFVEELAEVGIDTKAMNNRGQTPSKSFVGKKIDEYAQNNKSLTMNMFEIPVNNRKEALQDIITKTISQGNTDKLNIQEIVSFGKDGKPELSKIPIDKSILSKVFDDTSTEGAPVFFATLNQNDTGITMKHGDKYYNIPYTALGTLSDSARNTLMPRLQEYFKVKQNAIASYGEEVYYSSEIGAKIENAIQSTASDIMTQLTTQLGLEYKKPSVDVIQK